MVRHSRRPHPLRKGARQRLPRAALEGRPELLTSPIPRRGRRVVRRHLQRACGRARRGRGSLGALRDGSALAHLQRLTERLRAGLAALGDRYGVPVVRRGRRTLPALLHSWPVEDYRTALTTSAGHYAALVRALAAKLLIAEKPLFHSALSAAHTTEHVDEILAAAEDAFAEIAGER